MSELLDPRTIMAIRDLQLAAKTVIDGFMNGVNKSSLKGPGLEFSQYRSYQPGDDLRWLDWKMYGRSDRYYIRESEVETNISVRLLVDASGSMNHRDNGYSKLDYARYLAASLAYLSASQGDATGLYVFSERELYALTPKQDLQHMARLYHQLDTLRAGGKFTEPAGYRDIYARAGKRELLVFITDLYQHHDEIYALLDALAALKHEIVVFHVLGKNELEFDYKGYGALEDLETGETIRIHSAETRKIYQERLTQSLAAVRTELLNRNIVYRMISMDQPFGQALRDFLNQRNKS